MGKADPHLKIFSPLDGTVINRNVLAGQYVQEGTELYSVADLTHLWMQAEVFERDAGIVQVGQMVEIVAEAFLGEMFSGAVSFIYPTLQAETRTVRVRVEVPNLSLKLKPEMYVTTLFHIPLGQRGEVFYGCCPSCPEIRSDRPGKCSKCSMDLVKRGGVEGISSGKESSEERFIYVCDGHPEEVFDQPGVCLKDTCAGPPAMKLEQRRIAPGSKLIYVCPDHPEVQSEKPGSCPTCAKRLRFKVVTLSARLAERWVCSLHPNKTAEGKLKCPECGEEMKLLEFEQLLAVPFSAVIDTGYRKVVFVEREPGSFDADEVTLGPRAGEFYPVLHGVTAGDRVVLSGAFLLDAEARLNPAAGSVYFGASGQETKK
jgi:hypothetical protein